ncbi:hypothetical protein VSS37_09030 [Candidatus Thiothrix sp. Deng01]|uniref:Uncharacterized protein n=1 Tax=Candidatus Thiothrix phosphatis TaxID=3112415 RepID=A0ABU6CWG2_9GAMM|nr:hypothetical protein [Candidatus Thiothrix sp. Deng01]MEB4591119.1 hypothetical protein [Candidatus Thiothrix sp. Deng01]
MNTLFKNLLPLFILLLCERSGALEKADGQQPIQKCIHTAIKNSTDYDLYFDINPTAFGKESILVNQKINHGDVVFFCFSDDTVPLGIDRNLNMPGVQIGIFALTPGCFFEITENIEEAGILGIKLGDSDEKERIEDCAYLHQSLFNYAQPYQ